LLNAGAAAMLAEVVVVAASGASAGAVASGAPAKVWLIDAIAKLTTQHLIANRPTAATCSRARRALRPGVAEVVPGVGC
jgi:hypothetical protein